jgi:choline dehydrogenase
VPKLTRRYDYVIVGAGSAGCVVVRRLADGTDATVPLLEAGGSGAGVGSVADPPRWAEDLGSPYDWACRYEPGLHVDNRPIPLAQGKVLGDSGSINGIVWTRGQRADYGSWAETGNDGWDFPSALHPTRKNAGHAHIVGGIEPGFPGVASVQHDERVGLRWLTLLPCE